MSIGSITVTAPGWATFAYIALPGQAVDGFKVGHFTTQTDVKTRWPDGSIQHALVCAKVDAGTWAIESGPASGLEPILNFPSAQVRFAIGGTLYTATFVITAPGFRNGSEVGESRWIVAPVDGAGSPHPSLQVVFDIRVFRDGGSVVDVCVQNVVNTAAGDAVLYDVAVMVNGNEVFTKSAVTHHYQTRWRKVFPSTPLAEVIPDLTPFVAAGLIPALASTVADHTYPDVSGPAYDILTWGDMTPYMPEAGGRPEIGFYPNWTVQYLVHRTPNLRAYMLKHADLSGSWSGHLTQADGQSPISLDDSPNFFFDPRAASIGVDGPLSWAGTTELLENAHLPSLPYVPYLITGDRYYLDQMALWANFAVASTPPGDPWRPRGPDGIVHQNQVRGIAWALRALAEAATACPDADPRKAYFTKRLQANLDFFDHYSRTEAAAFGPLEIVTIGITNPFPSGASFVDGGEFNCSHWQQCYLVGVLDHCVSLGFTNATHMRDRIARFALRLITSEPDYDRDFGAPYMLAAGTVNMPGGAIPAEIAEMWVPYDSIATVMRQSFGTPPPATPPNPVGEYYGPLSRAAVIIAARNGESGADPALAWLEAEPGLMQSVNETQCGFALAPAPEPPEQPQTPPPTCELNGDIYPDGASTDVTLKRNRVSAWTADHPEWHVVSTRPHPKNKTQVILTVQCRPTVVS